MNNKVETEKKSETRVFKCKACGSFNEIKYRSDEIATQLRQLPEGLESFLIDFTVNLLKQNPSDSTQMTQLAYEYFSRRTLSFPDSYITSKQAFSSSK